MNPSSFIAEAAGDSSSERNQIVTRSFEVSVIFLSREPRASDFRHVFIVDHAEFRPCLTRRNLDLQPEVELVMLRLLLYEYDSLEKN